MKSFQKKSAGTYLGQISWFVTFKFDMSAMRFAKTAQGIPVFLCRVKLRTMLEWSSLYRVALLLSKINDDSDLDAEAAILYGKVGVRLFSQSLKRYEVVLTEGVE